MKTTKPFLVLDLEKSWREDIHPRDKHGKFTTVKGGSRIVTKAGKTGVVQSVSDSHYSIRTDDGKLSKITKDNVLHEKDHKRAVDEQKKAKKRSASAKKGATAGVATKAQKKADGNAVATKLAEPKGKVTAKPKTAKKVQNDRVKAMEQKATKERRANLAEKKKRDMEAPVMMRAKDQASAPKAMKQTIPQNTSTARKEDQAQKNTAVSEYNNLENTLQPGNLDEMWKDSKVSALLKKPMEKRSAEDIKKLAGEMTTANDKLARKVVLKMGEARGYNLASQVNRIGNSATPSANVKVQETNLYGDLLQSARSSMFETIHNVLAGSQNPSEGTAIGQHVIRRMKDAVHKDIYTLMNSIPAPERIRQAMGDMNRGQADLSQKLGRTPTEVELGVHLMKTSESFKTSPINELPYWDDKSSEWVAPRTEVKDPRRRLELLKHYAQQQRTVSGDTHIGGESEREININSNLVDSARSPQEIVERKERQKELKGTLPKAMRDMGMTDASITAFQAMYSQPSETGTKPQMTLEETASFINKNGGWNGKPISGKWVDKHVREGRKVIAEAMASQHPAIQQLAMLKSFVFNMILKGMYEYDLVKSIHAWT
jgi:preprotein translocase subunit YajC